jgi:NAD dependent epimerase/dehydratase
MSWKGRRVLITGAGGFIGSHLAEAMVHLGADVTAVVRYTGRSGWGNLDLLMSETRAALHVVAGNVEDAHFVMRIAEGQHVVFHLAALIAIPYSYLAPTSYVRTNVEGTLNVLEAVRFHRIGRLVHTSTSEVYGTALYTPIDEKHPLQGQSPYSASKIGADKLVESYYKSFGLPVVTLRPFNTYGPRQSARAVIPTIISQALSQAQIRLGSLTPVRDFNYVQDTVSAFVAVAGCDEAIGSTLNAGSGTAITVGDTAARILRLLGMEKSLSCDEERLRPEKSEVFTLICDHRQITSMTGWQPRYSLDDGLQATIDFVRTHPELYRPESYAR